ncbi:MAG: hypothetical protein WCI75_18915, partial [candidate division NC10 bacterium]
MRSTKALMVVLGVAILSISTLAVAACGGSTEPSDTSSPGAASPASGEPFKIGFLEGFTGFMAVDAA